MRCPCREWPTFEAFKAHRDAGECPHNSPPAGSDVFAHWSRTVRAKTPAEREKIAATRERTAALKLNPVYQENARKRREKKAHMKKLVLLILVPAALLAAGGLL